MTKRTRVIVMMTMMMMMMMSMMMTTMIMMTTISMSMMSVMLGPRCKGRWFHVEQEPPTPEADYFMPNTSSGGGSSAERRS